MKLPRSSGEPAATQPKPVRVGEQPDLRGRSSSTRVNQDHTSTTTASAHAVNFRDASGAWQPIDAARVNASASGYAWANGSGTFKASLRSRLDASFLRLEIPGAAPATLSLAGSSPHSVASKSVYASAATIRGMVGREQA